MLQSPWQPTVQQHPARTGNFHDGQPLKPRPELQRPPQFVKKEIVISPRLRQAKRSLDPWTSEGRRAVFSEKNEFVELVLRTFRMSKLILLLCLSTSSALAGLSKIDALGMIESGNNDAAVGSSGEVSRYQIKPRIWREYSSSRSWRDVRIAALVAQDYVADLEDTFRKRARREPTNFDLYVLWNAGPAYYAKVGFAAERVHPVIRERAGRFVNLREMRNPQTLAVAPSRPASAPTATALPSLPLAQIITAPLPGFDSNALAPNLPGLAVMPLESRAIPAGRGSSSFLSAGGMHSR